MVHCQLSGSVSLSRQWTPEQWTIDVGPWTIDMLNAIIRFSLRNRVLIGAGSLAVLIYGGYSGARLPIDVLPDLDRPRVVVLTECPGMAPEEVEAQVTQPLETALQGTTGVQAVRSTS